MRPTEVVISYAFRFALLCALAAPIQQNASAYLNRQYTTLLAERWLCFAWARCPQNPYY